MLSLMFFLHSVESPQFASDDVLKRPIWLVCVCVCLFYKWPSSRTDETLYTCPSFCFALRPLSLALAKTRGNTARHLYLLSLLLSAPQSESPEGLVSPAALLPCYQRLEQTHMGPVWHHCKYWPCASNHSFLSEVSLQRPCVYLQLAASDCKAIFAL